jgi:putative transposase
MTNPVGYKRHRYPPGIIARAVWLYVRVPLSLRLVEEMLLERGVIDSYETIRRWSHKFGPNSARRFRWHCQTDIGKRLHYNGPFP